MRDIRVIPAALALMVQKAPMAALKRESTTQHWTALHILCQRDDRHDCILAIQRYVAKCPRAVVMRAKGGYTPLWFLLADPVLKVSLPLVRIFLDQWPDLLLVAPDSGKTPLEAVILGTRLDKTLLDYIVRTYPGILLRKFRSGRTLLHMACVQAPPANVLLLLQACPDALTLEDSFGETPLALACTYQPQSIVDKFLKVQPENLYRYDNSGYNALFAACRNQADPSVLVFLLEKAPHLVHKRGEYDGWLPLMYACFHGSNTNTIHTLLRFHPAALLDVDDDRKNPVHMACVHGSTRMVEILVDTHAELLRQQDFKAGWLPLHTACYHNNDQDTIELLLQLYPEAASKPDKDGRTPLHLASREVSDIEAIEFLVDAFPQALNLGDKLSRTPLHLAIRNERNDSVVRLLLSKDDGTPATIKTQDRWWTPLHYACYFDAKTSVIAQLVEAHPAALYEKDAEGWTPLQIACKRTARVPTVQLLLERTDDPDEAVRWVDGAGRSLLHLACQNKELKAFDVVRYLADTNPSLVDMTTPNEGWYPLHHACYHNVSITALQIVEYLVEKNPSNGEERDADDRTPLHLACRNTSPDRDAIVKLLVMEYPSLLQEKREKDDWLPLHYACYYNTAFESVRHIFNAYPEAAKEVDKEGQTPLQWAWLRHGEKKQIELMICQLYPDALYVEDPMKNRQFLKKKIHAEARLRGISVSTIVRREGRRNVVMGSMGSSKLEFSTINSEW